MPVTLSGDHPIFSEALRSRAGQAHYEMSALSIGVQLELSAVEFYEGQASTVPDSELKGFYRRLADWERGHYNALLAQQNSLKEDYWTDGGFSPF